MQKEMMSVKFNEILYDSRFRVLSKGVNLHSVTVSGLYVGDLLSFVMAKAKPGQIWLTIQAHPNVIAVASLINLSAVIVVEGVDIPQETIDVANESRYEHLLYLHIYFILSTCADDFMVPNDIVLM